MKVKKLWPLVLAILYVPAGNVLAGPLTEAQIVKIINDVRVINTQRVSRTAELNEMVKDDMAVKTGAKSRAELLFADKTLTRLGADTLFTFTPGTRDMSLGQGTMLLQVPKGLGGAKIRTAAVTASITGTTIMIEYQPKSLVRVIVLEGSLRLFINHSFGESVVITAGRMVMMNPNDKKMPAPVDVDLRKLVKSSNLVNISAKSKTSTTQSNSSIQLPSAGLIQNEIGKQDAFKATKGLIETNLVILGDGKKVAMVSDKMLAKLDQGQPANGGKNTTQRDKVSNAAVSISNSSQLLVLLSRAKSGQGRKVKFVPDDVNTQLHDGTITLDKGPANIRNKGTGGLANLSNAALQKDVVKVGVLGTDGTLIVNGKTISPNTALALYSGASNGKVLVTSNASFSGASTKKLASTKVAIASGKTVTLGGTKVTNGATTATVSAANTTASSSVATVSPAKQQTTASKASTTTTVGAAASTAPKSAGSGWLALLIQQILSAAHTL